MQVHEIKRHKLIPNLFELIKFLKYLLLIESESFISNCSYYLNKSNICFSKNNLLLKKKLLIRFNYAQKYTHKTYHLIRIKKITRKKDNGLTREITYSYLKRLL